MEVILWISIGLFIVALISVVANVRKHRKMFKKPVNDDFPGRYEESERPYYESYN
jgi:hypothetical protein